MAREEPIPVDTISSMRPTSMPDCSARAIDSAMPTIEQAKLTWLQSLAVWPAPARSKKKIRDEKLSRMGRTGAASASEMPAIRVRVPATAPASPPVTGQSKAWTSLTAAASWISRASRGEDVVRSMSQLPLRALASRPSPAR